MTTELTQRKAEDIPEWELEEMIRDVIHQGMRAEADIAERAPAWLDLVGTVIGVLRREMPGIVKEAGLAPF